jgi:drug/metabolite transporter (DMT)-like permease
VRHHARRERPLAAIALALLASLGWGCSDFLGGLRTRSLPLRAVAGGMFAGGLLTAAAVTIVRGSGYPGNGFLVAGVIAGLSSLVAVTTLYKALAIGSMSIVAPINAAYPIVPVIYGLAHGERPSGLQLAGMALVVAGVIVASYVRESADPDAASHDIGSQESTDLDRVAVVPMPDVGGGFLDRARADASSHRPRLLASVVLAVVATLASGSVLTALSSAAETDPYWALIVVRAVALSGMLMIVFVTGAGLGVRPAQVPLLLGIGALDTVATGFFAVATTYGYLSVVSVIAALFPLGTMTLAWLVLGERMRPYQYAGVAGALTGVALVALG